MKKRTDTTPAVLNGMLNTITSMMNYHDPSTAGHQEQVALLAKNITEYLCHDEEMTNWVFLAGQIHDIGKITVPAAILASKGRLNENQRLLVMQHAQAGYDMIKAINFPWHIADVIYQHHERVNGSGYPQGLSGDKILLESRILAVADVVQAMFNKRSYRPPFELKNVLDELEAKKGTLYDTDVVNAYRCMVETKGPSRKRRTLPDKRKAQPSLRKQTPST